MEGRGWQRHARAGRGVRAEPSALLSGSGSGRTAANLTVVAFAAYRQFRSGQCLGLVPPKATLGADAPPASAKVPLEFALAMFLLARETHNNTLAGGIRSHFEYDHDGWAGWPRWADSDTSWEEVKALFAKVAAAGEPLEDVVESAGAVFSRKFEGLTVSVDCTKRLSNYSWA